MQEEKVVEGVQDKMGNEEEEEQKEEVVERVESS